MCRPVALLHGLGTGTDTQNDLAVSPSNWGVPWRPSGSPCGGGSPPAGRSASDRGSSAGSRGRARAVAPVVIALSIRPRRPATTGSGAPRRTPAIAARRLGHHQPPRTRRRGPLRERPSRRHDQRLESSTAGFDRTPFDATLRVRFSEPRSGPARERGRSRSTRHSAGALAGSLQLRAGTGRASRETACRCSSSTVTLCSAVRTGPRSPGPVTTLARAMS